MFGTMREVDLKPGGSQLMVTEENKVSPRVIFLLLHSQNLVQLAWLSLQYSTRDGHKIISFHFSTSTCSWLLISS